MSGWEVIAKLLGGLWTMSFSEGTGLIFQDHSILIWNLSMFKHI